jgi:TetR/AcrR family transcriptional regulator, cholesterol catabolism regulator
LKEVRPTFAVKKKPHKSGDSTYERIMETSLKLFEKKGYRDTTIREIAKKVGINQGTLYYHFKSKADILCEIHDRALDLMMENISARKKQEVPEKEELELIIRDILNVIANNRAEFTIFFKDYSCLPPAHLKRIRAFGDDIRIELEKTIKKGQDKRMFKAFNPRIVALGLLGMCNWSYLWYNPDGAVSMDEIVDIFSQVFLKGIER